METQAIREVKRAERTELTVFDRLRGRRRVDPLRETADGLGVVLDKLSESVTAVLPRGGSGFAGGEDGADEDGIEAGRRTRGFKLRQYQDAAPPAEVADAAEDLEAEAGSVAVNAQDAAGERAAGNEIAEEVADVIDILREARDVAAEAVAPPVVMPAHDRATAQAKLKELFVELGMKRIEIISAIFNGPEEVSGAADLFSLSTPDGAKAAYKGIDAMIMKFLNAGRDEASAGAGSVYEGHEAAISATERLKEYLRNESPERAFMRFREVNRSNILGLLQ